jgi:hypothetical protein
LTLKDYCVAVENLDNVLGKMGFKVIVTGLTNGDEGAVFEIGKQMGLSGC